MSDFHTNLLHKLKAMQPMVERGQALDAQRLDERVRAQRRLEGWRAAVRDSETEKVYSGWTHR